MAVATAVGLGCYMLAEADANASPWRLGTMERAWEFIFFMAGLAGAIAFSLTLVLLTRRARRRDRDPPRAIVVRRELY